jgi:predicted pyridoxine 5'-phosphate oxidase superfamily flavin-nucleotide-binding protein
MGILTDDMKRVVREQKLGFVATVSADGTPNLSPKGTFDVLDDDRLVFCDIRSPNTIRNLRTGPSIEVNFVDQFVRKGYRFKGVAEIVTVGPVYDSVMQAYSDRPEIASRVKAVVIITVQKASPITSPAYDWGETEESLRERYMRYFAELNG